MNSGEFAAMAGVTVRALHHYDRLGLLKPRRTSAGYRDYQASDLERLEQIVALKFLGLPLNQIRELLGRKALDLAGALRSQRRVLEEKRRLIGYAIDAMRQAESSLESGKRPEAATLKKIIEVIEMQDMRWAEKYYAPEAREKIEARKQLWTPELQAQATQQWTELFAAVEAAAAAGENPAGETAQALAERWRKLVEAFTGGDYEISSGLKQLWTDQANWPTAARQYMKPFLNRAVWDFIGKAMAYSAASVP